MNSAVSQDRINEYQKLVCKIAKCDSCSLHENRNNTVPGEGPLNASIMIIGEGPGEENDKTGRPFVGRGGQLLDKYLSEAHLERSNLFLTNIIKCRMPHNETPSKNVIQSCFEFLETQISIIQPKVIITLGLPAAKVILQNKKIKLADIKGQSFKKEHYIVMCTYHPSSVRYNKDAAQQIVDTLSSADVACKKW